MASEVCIVTFPTTHVALLAEKTAAEVGLSVRMIPVPRELSSDCNIGMEAALEDMDELRLALASKEIECDIIRWKES